MCKFTKIMGIVNVNEDSFFSSSRVKSQDEFCSRVDKMIEDGADIIDIGACSSRPGSVYEGVDVEWNRLKMVLPLIPNRYPNIRFSVDTFSSEIARRVYDNIGDFIVNDISAGENDPNMLSYVGEMGFEYVAMHKRGNPDTMDSLSQYDNVVNEIKDYFADFERKAFQCGISKWILDPGFGFAKTIEQNLYIMDNLAQFKSFEKPILVGISMKRMTNNSLEETCRLHEIAIANGANILRVHDVKAAKLLVS